MAYTAQTTIRYGGKAAWVRIVGLGCVHQMAKAHAEKHFKAAVKRIEDDPNCYWLGLGDWCEYIIPSDKRYDAKSLTQDARAEDIMEQCERSVKPVEGIADRCLGFLAGNHERSIAKKGIMNPARYIAKLLGCPYLGGKGYLHVTFRRHCRGKKWDSQSFVIFAKHATSGSSKDSLLALRRLMETRGYYLYDMAFSAHVHYLGSSVEPMLEVVPSKSGGVPDLREKNVFYGISGTFRKETPVGFDDYGDDCLPRRPARLGCAVAKIQPYHRIIVNEEWQF